MEFNQSRTYANLVTAFAGESQARIKYTLYAEKARTEGYQQIAGIFEETARNEQAHAEIWLKQIDGGELLPTLQNLKNAAGGENYEWSEMYKAFAQQAREEGYPRIATLFDLVATVEKEHEARYLAFVQNMEEGQVFKKLTPQKWVCRNCGYVYEGTDAPPVCPACSYVQAFFEVQEKDYGKPE